MQLTESLTAVAVLIVGAAVAACNATLSSGECAISGAASGATGTGGGMPSWLATTTGAGAGAPTACDCPEPINFIPECRTMRLTSAGCMAEETANGLPCRGGVGVCFSGLCNAPNAPGQCEQAPAGAPWPACENKGDCDDVNPCTMDSCPAPGCASCLHVPVQDGTACGQGQQCVQGACCDTGAP